MKKIYLLVACGLLQTGLLHAQGSIEDHLKAMNSVVPGSPQAAQIMKYVDYPVELYTGTPHISIPLYTVIGKDITVPISLSYHAGGGIKVDEQAGRCGLGWSLQAGGEISREIRGTADDKSVAGFLNKPQPISYYLNKLRNEPLMDNVSIWVDAMHGQLDLEPDIYYFSFGEYSGKFIYDDSTQQFLCLTEKNHLKISLDQPASTWTIITGDGTKYIFAAKEQSSTQIYTMWQANNPSWSQPEATSWKLSKIVNADATDSIVFQYTFNEYEYYTTGSSIAYQLISGNGAPYREPYQNSFVKTRISGSSKLAKVISSTDSVSFVEETTARQDLASQYALSKIVVSSRDGIVKDIFKFNYSYFNRQAVVGALPGDGLAYLQKSLRLDNIKACGNSESNANPLTHSFSYNGTQLPCRLSYAQDFWGYANNNTVATTLVPPMVINVGGTSQTLDGAYRYPDSTGTLTKAGILEQITLPTRGTVTYQYEPNTVGYPIQQAITTQLISVSNLITRFKAANQYFDPSYDTTFTVSHPANQLINNMLGGVMADLIIFPISPGGSEATPINNAAPYFLLESLSFSDPNPPPQPIIIYLQYGNRYQVHLPNGTYRMTAYTNGLNNDLSTTRAISFNVTYKILNTTSGPVNYTACGLRVKSITSKDPYTNNTKVRRFRYHDPVTDSSYGKFIGTDLNYYYEELQPSNGGGGQYLVRLGNNNMPGQGNSSSGIIYPKVIEEVSDNGIMYRTEYRYTVGIPFYPYYGNIWPFVPAIDIECGRGNEELTEVKQFQSGNFLTAQRQRRVFKFALSPEPDPIDAFGRKIYGIKATSDSYYDATYPGSQGGNFPPQYVQEYYTNTSRLYLTSDSTTTYDLSSGSAPHTEWRSYTYGSYNLQPLTIASGTSDGTILTQKNWYASDQPGATTEISSALTTQMVAQNRVEEPLGTELWKGSQLLSRSFSYAHFSGDRLLLDSVRQARLSNPLEAEMKVLAYDEKANPLTQWMRGNKYRKYLWYKPQNLALASCAMARDGAFYFTSFEQAGESGWNPSGRVSNVHFTGSYAYNLSGNTIALSGFNSNTPIEIYAWMTSGSFSANGNTAQSTGRASGSWVLYKAIVPAGTTSISIGGTGIIDQLAVVPQGSDFKGVVYDNAARVIATVGQNMETTFFDYDVYGRMSKAKNEKGEIVKQQDYQYQGPQ